MTVFEKTSSIIDLKAFLSKVGLFLFFKFFLELSEVQHAVVPVVSAAEGMVSPGAVVVAVRIFTCTDPIGGTMFTI